MEAYCATVVTHPHSHNSTQLQSNSHSQPRKLHFNYWITSSGLIYLNFHPCYKVSGTTELSGESVQIPQTAAPEDTNYTFSWMRYPRELKSIEEVLEMLSNDSQPSPLVRMWGTSEVTRKYIKKTVQYLYFVRKQKLVFKMYWVSRTWALCVAFESAWKLFMVASKLRKLNS